MKTARKFTMLIFVLLLAALGISLQMKAAIGLAPFDAVNQTAAYAFDVRVGDVVTVLQFFFVVIQVLILRKDTKWTLLLQVFIGALLGQFVNFFFYNVFGNLIVDNYVISLLLLLFAVIWTPLFIGAVMVLDLASMPLESLSLVIANKINRPFGQIRQYADILFLVISLVLTFIYALPFTIREGTVVSAITFGPLLTFFMPRIEKVYRKWNII